MRGRKRGGAINVESGAIVPAAMVVEVAEVGGVGKAGGESGIDDSLGSKAMTLI